MIEPELGSAGDHPILHEGRDFCYLVMAGSDVFRSCSTYKQAKDGVTVPGDEIKDPIFSAAPVDEIATCFQITDGKPDGTSPCFCFRRHGRLRFFVGEMILSV